MKITSEIVGEAKEIPKKPFPKVMRIKNSEALVYFYKHMEGVCISSGEWNIPLEYSKEWTMDNFQDIEIESINIEIKLKQ